MAAAPVEATPVADIDSNSMIVPPITTSELLGFAVNGTLPIDLEREKFITVGTAVPDSLAITLHGAQPWNLPLSVGSLGQGSTKWIDSLSTALRTALLQYSDEGIVVRGDLALLRMRALQHLAAATQLPAEARRAVAEARQELAAVRPDLNDLDAHYRQLQRAYDVARTDLARMEGQTVEVPYFYISLAAAEQGPTRVCIPLPSAQASASNVVYVDGGTLGTLRSCAENSAQVSAGVPAVRTEAGGNLAGVRVGRSLSSESRDRLGRRTEHTRPLPVNLIDGSAEMNQEPPPMIGGSTEVRRVELQRVETLIQNAERILIRVDSIQRVLDSRSSTRGNVNSSVGAGGGDSQSQPNDSGSRPRR